jgi:hypothetical protein
MPHLGILNADAAILGHPVPQDGLAGSIQFYILCPYLLGGCQTLGERLALLPSWVLVDPPFHAGKRGDPSPGPR